MPTHRYRLRKSSATLEPHVKVVGVVRPVTHEPARGIPTMRVLEQRVQLGVGRAASACPLVEPALDAVIEEDDLDAGVEVARTRERREQRPRRLEVELRVGRHERRGIAIGYVLEVEPDV